MQEEISEGIWAVASTTMSGAALTWRHFTEVHELPELVKYVSDYDTWQFKYGLDTKFINKYLQLVAKTTTAYGMIFDELQEKRQYAPAFDAGCNIQQYHDRLVNSICKDMARPIILITPEGTQYRGLCAHAPKMLASDVGHKLATMCGTYGCSIIQRSNGNYEYSLRSLDSDLPTVDVSVLAEVYGGGGHKCAAGFTIAGNPEELM